MARKRTPPRKAARSEGWLLLLSQEKQPYLAPTALPRLLVFPDDYTASRRFDKATVAQVRCYPFALAKPGTFPCRTSNLSILRINNRAACDRLHWRKEAPSQRRRLLLSTLTLLCRYHIEAFILSGVEMPPFRHRFDIFVSIFPDQLFHETSSSVESNRTVPLSPIPPPVGVLVLANSCFREIAAGPG